MHNPIDSITFKLGIGPPLTPQEIEEAIVSASTIASNRHEFPANVIAIEFSRPINPAATSLKLAIGTPISK